MNQTTDLIFTIVGGALTLLTVYGVIKLNRIFFLSGLFFFSFLPLIGETMGYNADKAPVHIMVIFIFIVQLVLAIPNKISYAQDNTAVNKLIAKIGLAFIIINIAGAVYIFCLNPGIPMQFGYYHIVFALAVAYLMLRRMSGKGAWVK